jgi:uncharacterized membrane protein
VPTDTTRRPPPAASAITPPTRRGLEREDIRRLVVFSVNVLVVVPVCAWLLGGFRNWADANWRPRLDGAVFASAPVSTRTHVALVLALVASGWAILALPKGDRRHRTLGWTWVCAMLAMGAASLTVPHGPNWVAAYVGGASAYPLLAYGVYAVKRGDRRRHGRTMAMLMIALVLMTLLAVFPGRLMHDVLFGG